MIENYSVIGPIEYWFIYQTWFERVKVKVLDNIFKALAEWMDISEY